MNLLTKNSSAQRRKMQNSKKLKNRKRKKSTWMFSMTSMDERRTYQAAMQMQRNREKALQKAMNELLVISKPSSAMKTKEKFDRMNKWKHRQVDTSQKMKKANNKKQKISTYLKTRSQMKSTSLGKSRKP